MSYINAVDILFIIMAAFGFYFGFSFGLMKVALMVLSLAFAVLTAMAFTPMTTNIIIDTFNIDTVFLPFIAFFITLLIVLMLARILTKLIEETVDNKRFDIISQVVGGLVMGIIFTLLYSVLVIFFGQAGVVKLIFNDEITAVQTDRDIRLVAPAKRTGLPDTIYMKIDDDHNPYKFKGRKEKKEDEGAASLSFGFKHIETNTYRGYVGTTKQQWDILPEDTVRVKSGGQLYLMIEDQMRCFCDSTFLVESVNNTIKFQCMDDYLAAKSTTSFFYKYIEVIPQRGTQVMKGIAPFIKEFLDYMSIALERLNEQKVPKDKPINVYSEEEHKNVVQPVEEYETPEPDLQPRDSLEFANDSINQPTISPTKDTISNTEESDDEPEEEVEYEG
ncbi:CvpA family protein [Aureispira anguillae]|uniref:CvpA family protein n=1 Tax=Aureispira anguillae TaxID=2864201 RepID=A0A915YJF3_9BACT|nr:CvpA family protein [Aureispira anguillae]BDS14175.1 CvpA family protein [Aureispira anguillae]